ncbi:helix-turn-helix domain-containing protein [Cellulosilyticum sp. I15G10I2]|uniref:helix-turn-helix domain-containing protein n=1 Tax=Cellulosilyticum sp. I15G10I2 TaxID=1892843 RepID=UPI00085CB545|nr:helix-turn-helix transcriptional regulator [Cellulosilyticum sp. I15G10I2]
MNNIDPIAFGQRLKEALKNNNITQKDIAQKIGVSKTSINNYVQGRIPDAVILYQLALNCDVSVEWLLTGNDSKTVSSTYVESVKTEGTLVLLSREEEYLINLVRQLPPRDRIKLEGIVEEKVAECGVSKNTVPNSSAYTTGNEDGEEAATLELA